MPRPIKILITTPTFPPYNSGLGNAAQEQVRILMALGCEVTIATYGEQRESDFKSGYRIEKFNITGADSLISPIRGEIESYTSFLTESHFDLLIANAWQTWSTDILLRCLDRVAGKKILCSHCISTELFFWKTPIKSLARYLLWRPYRFRIKRYLRQLDGLVVLANDGCDSRFDDLRMARAIGASIFVIPNALPEPLVFAADEERASIADRSQIISVGAYEWLKGHDFVLRAYAKSEAKNSVPLKIFGQQFTPYTTELRALARRLDISDDFLSFHEGISGPALQQEYRHARVFLYGSHTECQPLVLLDAMAAGTPFVSRASGCIDAMLGGVAVATEVAAARQLDNLLNDSVKWLEQSAAGSADIKMYSHESVSAKWHVALGAILGTPAVAAISLDRSKEPS